MRKLIELANNGELGAIRICMDRLVPSANVESVACDLPPMNKPMDAVAAMTRVFDALRVGDLTSAEADKPAKFVHTWVRSMVIVTHEARLREIEKQQGIADPWPYGPPAARGDNAAGEPADQDAKPSGRLRDGLNAGETLAVLFRVVSRLLGSLIIRGNPQISPFASKGTLYPIVVYNAA